MVVVQPAKATAAAEAMLAAMVVVQPAKATAAAEAMLAAAAEATGAGFGKRVSLLAPQRMHTSCALCHIGRSGGPRPHNPMDRQSSARGKRAHGLRRTIAPRRRPRCTTYTFRSTSCRSQAP